MIRQEFQARRVLGSMEARALRTVSVADAVCVRTVTPSDTGRGGGEVEVLVQRTMGDLVAALTAATRVVHVARECTPPYQPFPTATLIVTLTRAVDLAIQAADSGREDVEVLLELSRATARAADCAAHALLEGDDRCVPSAGDTRPWVEPGYVPVSWVVLVRVLAQRIATEAGRHTTGRDEGVPGPRRMHLQVARAARDAAIRAMSAHDRCSVASAPQAMTCRVARHVARASAHAGLLALRVGAATPDGIGASRSC